MELSALTDIYTNLMLQLQRFPDWIAIVAIIIAALDCFLGYRLMKIWIALIGFIIGAVVGYSVCDGFVNNLGFAILAGLLAGLAIAFMAYRIYLLGVWMLAFVMTLQLVFWVRTENESWQLIIIIGGIILAAVVGFAAMKFVRPVIIVSSSLSGAVIVVSEVLKLLGDESRIMLLAGIGILTALGAAVQFATTKRTRR